MPCKTPLSMQSHPQEIVYKASELYHTIHHPFHNDASLIVRQFPAELLHRITLDIHNPPPRKLQGSISITMASLLSTPPYATATQTTSAHRP